MWWVNWANVDPSVIVILALVIVIFAGILVVVARYGGWNGALGFLFILSGVLIGVFSPSLLPPWVLWIVSLALFLLGLFLSVRAFHK